MEAPLDPTVYKEALIVLGAAGVVIPLFYRLRVSPVLGFMLVGVVVGPVRPRLAGDRICRGSRRSRIGDPESIQPIARLGVALLLFMIGLELSFERLWLMRRLVFGLGACSSCCAQRSSARGATASGKAGSARWSSASPWRCRPPPS